MNGNDSTRFDRESSAEPITEPPADVEDLTPEERAALAERLDRVGEAIHNQLRDLAAVVKAGEDVPEDRRVRTALRNVDLAEETVRRHLGGVPERDLDAVALDPRERDFSTFGEVEDAEALVDAPAEEVAAELGADVEELRTVADRVDRQLLTGELTDVEVSALWDAAGRVEAWSRDVLTARTDRELLLSREEAEAADAGDVDESGEPDHA